MLDRRHKWKRSGFYTDLQIKGLNLYFCSPLNFFSIQCAIKWHTGLMFLFSGPLSRSNALSFIGIFFFLIKMLPLLFISSRNLSASSFLSSFLVLFVRDFVGVLVVLFQTSYSLLICSLWDLWFFFLLKSTW